MSYRFEPHTLIDVLEQRAERTPDLRLFTFLDGGKEEHGAFTPAEIAEQARAIAAWLEELGLSGKPILLLFPQGLSFIAAFFGCAYAGAVAIPAPMPQRARLARTLPRLQGMLADAAPAAVLTNREGLAMATEITAHLPERAATLQWLVFEDCPWDLASTWRRPVLDPGAAAHLQYTSGSTAAPKGTVITHANVIANSRVLRESKRYSSESRSVVWVPHFHDDGLIHGLIQPIHTGYPCILMPASTVVGRPEKWLRTIDQFRATHSGGPNFIYEHCLRKVNDEQCAGLDLSSWTFAYNAAEPVRVETLRRFFSQFARWGFRWTSFAPCYGLAEATLTVSVGLRDDGPHIVALDAHAFEREGAIRRVPEGTPGARILVGCGAPVGNTEVLIVDSRTGVRCAGDRVGEILVKCPSIAAGYLGRTEESARTFQARLDSGEGPFLRTGDQGFLLDGELFVTGRIKDLIIIRGENRYPQDIELTVESCHSAIAPGAIAAFSVDIGGEERLAVVAEIKKEARETITDKAAAERIFEAIREGISRGHDLYPYAILLLSAGTLPKTSSGKIQRQACRKAFVEGTLHEISRWEDSLGNEEEQVFSEEAIALRRALEEAVPENRSLLLTRHLLLQTAAVLRLDPDHIDENAPFTRLGMDSLTSHELRYRIEASLGMSLPATILFTHSSVAELCAHLVGQSFARAAIDVSESIPRIGEDGATVVSRGQERLWVLDKFSPRSALYNMQAALCMRGRLNRLALSRALTAFAERHAALRTTFREVNGRPVAVVNAPAAVELEMLDLRALPPENRAEALTRISRERNAAPFDLGRGPLWRNALVVVDDGQHVLLSTQHHIISDGWSISIFLEELSHLYDAFCKRGLAKLPPLPIEYSDYAHWQRVEFVEGRQDESLSWWKERLSDVPRLDLPIGRQAVSPTHAGDAVNFVFSPELGVALADLARSENCTLFVTLLAAWATLLHRYSGQADFPIATVTAGRNRQELRSIFGFFVNTLVLRCDVSERPSFVELMRRMRYVVVDSLLHEDVQFDDVVRVAGATRGQDLNPLVQASFVLESSPLAPFSNSEMQWEMLLDKVDGSAPGMAKFNLGLSMVEEAGRLWGTLEYATDLFERAAIERMVGHFEVLLQAIVRQPNTGLDDLPLLTKAEQAQLAAWNDMTTPFPADKCIHELFDEQVARTPDAIAVVFEQEKLTYAELNTRANQLAHYLRSLGVGPEVLVGLCVERSIEMVVGLLAILKAGGAYVPLDPAYPAERLSFMLADAGVDVLLTQAHLVDKLPKHDARIVRLDADAWQCAKNQPSILVNAVVPENVAYVMYTSGSTGKPKAACVAHRSVVRLVKGANFMKMGPDETFLQLASIVFDASTLEVWGPLLNGGKLVVHRVGPLDFDDLAGALRKHEISTLWLTAGLFHQFVERHAPALSNVRHVLVGGDVVSPEHARMALEHMSGELINGYGPTENTTFTCWHRIGSQDTEKRALPIGRPISNTQALVLGANHLLVPIGISGELYAAGDGLARGYLNRPGLTAERFVPNPLASEPGARMYRTGDLARWNEDGNLEFLGRRDHQVKIRGFRIELGEIESSLATHVSVRACVVVVREDVPNEKRLVAYVVPNHGGCNPNGLREHLQAKLPDYMIPAAFVVLESLPLTPNGKVDRQALPAPDESRVGTASTYVAARTATEHALVAIWEELLGVKPIGIVDDFFALGGHSLLAVRLVSAMQTRLGHAPAMATVFAHPTIEALAKQIDGAAQGPSLAIQLQPKARKLGESAYSGLSGAERRLWFLHRLEPEARAYQVPTLFRIQGEFDESALRSSLDELVQRHEILRTTYPEEGGALVRHVSSQTQISLRIEDVARLPREKRTSAIQDLFAAELSTPFDMENGPLTRVWSVRESMDTHLVLVHQHHIITDEWSSGVLLRELSVLYESARRGESARLAALDYQYSDYARAEQESLDAGGFEASRMYWQEKLVGMPRLSVPIIRPKADSGAAPEGHVHLRVSLETSNVFHAWGRRNGCTPFIAWYALFAALLSRYGLQTDVGMGAVVANRDARGADALLGFFTNTVVFRIDLSKNPTVREIFARAKQTAMDAYHHQALPFDVVVRDQGVARRAGENPLYDVVFFEVTGPNAPLKSFSPLDVWSIHQDGWTSAKDPLSVAVRHESHGTTVMVSFDTSRVERIAAERLLNHLQTLLHDVVAHPDKHLSELELLSVDEKAQLAAWSATATSFPVHENVHELFEEQVEKNPAAVAIVFENEKLTYADLNTRANQLAHHLAALGVGPEVLVGLYLERSLELVIGLLAILKAGGAYVPLDPAYPSERLAWMLADARVPVLLTQAQLVDKLPKHDAHVVRLDADASSWLDQPNTNPKCGALAENVAYVIYTSGSTGLPKGVAVAHRGLPNLVHARAHWQTLEPGRMVLLYSSFAFDASVSDLFAGLVAGAGVLIVSEAERADMEVLSQRLASVGAAVLPPAILPALSPDDVPATVSLAVAGEACEPTQTLRWSQRHPLLNFYGPTEATVWSTAFRATGPTNNLPMGGPIDGTQVHVVDATGALLPVGMMGELCIGGIGLARGYVNRPGKTAERFVPNPFSSEPGARMYRTGDLARWNEDGNLEFLGRIDHQVKIRGFRIELGEIEAAISAFPSVRTCVVLAREDVPGDKRLVAYVVSNGADDADSVLREHLRKTLPDYMIPTAFVVLDALPLSPNGKVDRKALPAPDVVRTDRAAGPLAARTPTEHALVAIWEDVLGIRPIGIEDDFFMLGGHSLLAVRLISATQAQFGRVVHVVDLFQHPTIANLARVIDAAHIRDGAPSLQMHSRAEGEGAYRGLSGSERRIWFLEKLTPEAHSYQVPVAMRIAGEFDLPALRMSLNVLARRHEILRTTYPDVQGVPIRVVANEATIPLRFEDLSDRSETNRDTAMRALLAAEVQTPFDLAQGPLVRVIVVRLAADDHVVLLNQHHIITDEWSVGVLSMEWEELYWSALDKRELRMQPPPFQYADYARAEQSALEGDEFGLARAFWKKHLVGIPRLELPMMKPANADKPGDEAAVTLRIPTEQREALRLLGHAHGCTPFMTWYALFVSLLSRLSGQTDFGVGSVIANRATLDTATMLGFFTNTVVLRVNLEGDPSWTEILARVRVMVLDCLRHQALPFDIVVQDQGVVRRPGETPFYDVSYVEVTAPGNHGQRWSPFPEALDRATLTAKDTLTMSVIHESDTTLVYFGFDTSRLSRPVLEQLSSHFQVLLDDALAHPEKRLSELSLLTKKDVDELLGRCETTTGYPANDCVHERFARQAAITPDAIALEYGNTNLTYAELETHAHRLAHYLRALGVRPEVHVGVCLERSLDAVIGILAILEAGGAYVPIDPAYPASRIAFMARDARVALVLTQSALVNKLPPIDTRIVCIDGERAQWAALPSIAPPNMNLPENTMYVTYTSGSTGQPKGVLVSHRSVVSLLALPYMQDRYGAPSKVLQRASLSFDTLVVELIGPLLAGSTVVLLESEQEADTAAIAVTIRDRAVTYVDLTPTLLGYLLDEPAFGEAQHLRLVNAGGEALNSKLAKEFTKRCKAALWNAYGPTETTVDATYWPVDPSNVGDSVRIGRPLPNYRAYVLDTHAALVPAGVRGELHIAGIGLARGYLDRPALTAERFVPDPFANEPGARMYRTGDLVRWDDEQQLEFLGRMDDQVKIRGFRIELGEIESLLGQHEAVRSCAVLAREDEPGEKRIVAYVVPASANANVLRDSLRARLPEYMIPSVFVMSDTLPLTTTGKIDRQALPAPELKASGESAAHAPRSDTELGLAAIWAEVLRVDQIGIHDDFFALGGNSILTLRVVNLAKQMGLSLAARDIFSSPTIAQLAALQADRTSSIDAIDLRDEVVLDEDLTFGPQGMGRGVFVTGATGFVGAHILHRLLEQTDREIHCLLRGTSADEARARLVSKFEYYGLSTTNLPRAHIVTGDLTASLFGLSAEEFRHLGERVGIVIHGAAHVNHLAPYHTMKATNVGGARTVLRFCALSGARLHFLSTIDVAARRMTDTGDETHDISAAPPLATTGYAASKWVAEQLVLRAREIGLHGVIHRLGLVGGNRRTGALPLRDYWLTQALRLRLATGAIPDFALEIMPSDFVADFIARCALEGTHDGEIYNLDAAPVAPPDMLGILQKTIGRGRILPANQWRSFASQWITSIHRHDEGLEFILALIGQTNYEIVARPEFNVQAAHQKARSLGLAWPDTRDTFESTLRFVHEHADTVTVAPRRRPTTIEEFRALLVDMAVRGMAAPPITLDVGSTDVFVATYPKCGTTWTQQIIHGLRTRGSMDFEEISLVIPYIEFPFDVGIDINAPQIATPRAFKTHLSWSKVPKGGKYVYVMRDPRDALLSAYHFFNGWYFERDALDVRVFAEEMFLNFANEADGYWQHLRSWWEQRERNDVLFLCYEDMLLDHEGTVRRIADFMGIRADDELITLATRQSTIDFMRAHPSQFDDHQDVEASSRQMGLPSGAKTSKVRTGRMGGGTALPPHVIMRLDAAWHEQIEKPLGISSYDELRELLRKSDRGDRGGVE